MDELCNLENLCALAKTGQVSIASLQLGELSSSTILNSEEQLRVREFFRYVRLAASRIIYYPSSSIPATITELPHHSPLKQEMLHLMREDRWRPCLEDGSDHLWRRGSTLGDPKQYDPVLFLLRGHSEIVNHSKWFDGDRKAVSVSEDRSVKVWDVTNGQLLTSMEHHTGIVNVVEVSKDSSTIFSGSKDATIAVWEVSTGSLRSVLSEHSKGITGLSVSPNNQVLASCSVDGMVCIWSVDSLALVYSTSSKHLFSSDQFSQPPSFMSLSFNYESSLLAIGLKSGEVAVLSHSEDHLLSFQQLIFPVQRDKNSVRVICFFHHRNSIVVGYEQKIISQWDINLDNSCTLVKTFEGHRHFISCLDVSKDDTLLVSGAGYWDSKIRVWSIETGETLRVIDTKGSTVFSVAIAEDQQRVLSRGAANEILAVYDISNSTLGNVLDQDEATRSETHQHFVLCVAITGDGRQAVSSSGYRDGALHVWDLVALSLVRRLIGHKTNCYWVMYIHNEEHILSGCYNGNLIMWSASTGEQLRIVPGLGHIRTFAIVAPDLAIVSTFEKEFLVVDIEGQAVQRKWTATTTTGADDAESGDNSGEEEVEKSSPLLSFRLTEHQNRKVILGATEAGAIEIWDFEKQTLLLHLDAISKLSSSSRAFGANATIDRLAVHYPINGRNYVQLCRFDSQGATPSCISFVQQLGPFTNEVQSLRFSADGNLLYCGEYDKVISVWCLKTFKQLATLHGNGNTIHCIDISNDGTRVVSSGGDYSVRLWDVVTRQNK